MSQKLIECDKCEDETKRSTAIFGKGKEFPELVNETEIEDDDEITLCYDCYSEIK